AGVAVGADVAQRVTDVQPFTGRVREHVHDELLRRPGPGMVRIGQRPDRVGGAEGALPLPVVLPARLDLPRHGRVVAERGDVRTALGCLAHHYLARLLRSSRGLPWTQRNPSHRRGRRAGVLRPQHGPVRSRKPWLMGAVYLAWPGRRVPGFPVTAAPTRVPGLSGRSATVPPPG